MKTNKIAFMLIGIMLLVLLAGCASQPAAESVVQAMSAEEIATLPYNVTVDQTYEAMQSGDVFVLDVREQSEYDAGHIPGVTLIPMNEIPNRLDEIPADQQVIVTCRSGNRSSQVAAYLANAGFDNIHNMEGGIIAWESAGYPVEK
jgi:rhodanese-related sulfurtransferase